MPNNGNVRILSKKEKTWLRGQIYWKILLYIPKNFTKFVAFIINPALYLCFILFYFTAEWEEKRREKLASSLLFAI